MRVLVVGQGAREHALCWKIRQSGLNPEVYCAPGNPGIGKIAINVPLEATDLEGLAEFAAKQRIDLTVVGPEQPLSMGIVDCFRKRGLRIFGPSRAAARLESSKSFAKEIMRSAGVMTAAAQAFNARRKAEIFLKAAHYPVVIKADGLAAGKGVFICDSEETAAEALEQVFGVLKQECVIVEECLKGREASLIAATDGERIMLLPVAQDYKRAFDCDCGPNTGGMGAISPALSLPDEAAVEAAELTIRPVLREMKRRGHPFCGFLYAGLMIEPHGDIKVLEFNVRLGDPEAQVMLRRMSEDLLPLMMDLCDGRPVGRRVEDAPRGAAACVVLAADGYPGKPMVGDEIRGILEAESQPEVKVFCAAVTAQDGRLYTAGGRVLSITAVGADLAQARKTAYQAASKVHFKGMHYRHDIGLS